MTKRTPVSAPQNIWSDAQAVDDINLDLEQNHNNIIDASIINNHVGDGILPETLVQNVLFDSSLVTGFLDGVPVSTQTQPSDNNFGNQLQISLNQSKAAGKKTVKIALIGLDFQGNLQYETFYFRTNESQVSKKHFVKVLLILINDFIGNPLLSLNLGGRIIISEANPLTLSRDTLLVAQDQQPNLFFRDFFVDGFNSLNILLQTALPLYNTSTLNILSAPLDNIALSSGDVTTQLGEKFVATTNNIQKVTLLLSARNLVAGQQNNLVFDGDLVVSIYPLQSVLDCPTDIAPNLPIDFPPSNIPLVQVSVNYATLLSQGVVLDSIPQPVDFVFSNSPIASGNSLVPGNYYAVTIKRSGSASQADILVATGQALIPNSRVTTFTGTLWVDLTDQQLWFRVWTDAAKISDGQAYDSGNGIVIPKTTIDPTSQATIDNSVGALQFAGGDVFHAVVSAVTEQSDPVPDQRTGNPVDTVQQFVPKIQLLNTIDITNLEQASEPLIVGAIADKNVDFIDSVNSLLSSNLYSATIVNNELLVKIVDDPTDSVRFDSSVSALATSLLNGAFVGAKFYPNGNNSSVFYRVAEARLCSMISGDVDGNGIIDNRDLDALNQYLGYNLNVGLPTNSTTTTNGTTTTYTNGYTTYSVPFASQNFGSIQLVDPSTNAVIAFAADATTTPIPDNPARANVSSVSIDFTSIIGLSSYVLVNLDAGVPANHGGFSIVGLDVATNVITIQKIFLSGDVIGEMFRADIDGDFHITFNDGYLLQNYVERATLTTIPTTPFPGPTSNSYAKIGTRFNVIRFTLEKYIDRADDYSALITGRPGVVHPTSDIFLSDGYFAGHNFYTNPSKLLIQEMLTWDESLVITNSHARLVPSVFTSLTGYVENSCSLANILCNIYPLPLDFDPGLVDYFVPNNLIIGPGGELKRPDGEFYKVDFEVGTVVLEVPDGLFGSEKTIDVLNDFVVSTVDGANHQTGLTRLGFPAMKFSDCSYVTPLSLSRDQLRFSVAVQSFSPNTNGLSDDGYTGAIVDGKMGINIDYSTGLLTLNFTNLYQDATLQTLSTKIQVNVFLKKGGFNNEPLFVDSTKVQNMLSLVSIFSGANVGGPSALVDLTTDVTNVLPILHGGTGLNSVGTTGKVLTSNGTGLSYQFVIAAGVGYTAGNPADWAGSPPTTVQSALDRMAAVVYSLNGSFPIP